MTPKKLLACAATHLSNAGVEREWRHHIMAELKARHAQYLQWAAKCRIEAHAYGQGVPR